MSSEKKDLTRIEDLGEFIHELASEDDFKPEEDFPSELPDLPSSEADESPLFDSSAEETSSSLDFGTAEEFTPNDFSGDASDFTTSFSNESVPEATEFGTSFNEEPISDEFQTEDLKTDEVSWSTDVSLSSELEKDIDTFSLSEPKPEDQGPLPEPVLPFEDRSQYKAPETFEDLKNFSENSSFGDTTTEANPSFSVLLKNVRYIEDVQDIVSLLRELNLLVDSEDQIKSRLMRGMLLIPRISEYAAIFLAHKLRRFDIDIQVGLSDEIHPPKHQEKPETGIVSKHSLYQNQTHHFHFDDPKLEISQIIVSATPALEGYQVVKYIGVASEHKMIESHIVEDESSTEVPAHYHELAQKLKAHALKLNSNAVVGLNYQMTPIPGEYGMNGHKYRLTCTGNLVWVNKI